MIGAFSILQIFESQLFGKSTVSPKENRVQENEKGREIKIDFSHVTLQFPLPSIHTPQCSYFNLNSNALKRHNLSVKFLFQLDSS